MWEGLWKNFGMKLMVVKSYHSQADRLAESEAYAVTLAIHYLGFTNKRRRPRKEVSTKYRSVSRLLHPPQVVFVGCSLGAPVYLCVTSLVAEGWPKSKNNVAREAACLL